MKNRLLWTFSFLAVFSMASKAQTGDEEYCKLYYDLPIECTLVEPYGLVLDLSDEYTGVRPPIDSVWITNRYGDTYEKIFSANVQWGDTISLEPLIGSMESGYICRVRIGDCIKSERFTYYGEEVDYCLKYADNALSARVSALKLRYKITNTDKIEDFHVDSVWVVSYTYSKPDTMFVCYAQPEEDIDVSMLETGVYALFVQIGECVKHTGFLIHNPQAIEDPAVMPSATKILRDGQIRIRRGEKEWTIMGQEVR